MNEPTHKVVAPLRDHIINIRASKSEKQRLKDLATVAHLCLSDFMREAALKTGAVLPKAKPTPTKEGQQIALVLACLGRLADIVKSHAKDVEHQDRRQQIMLATLRREIMNVRDQCFTSLGRKP